MPGLHPWRVEATRVSRTCYKRGGQTASCGITALSITKRNPTCSVLAPWGHGLLSRATTDLKT